MDSLTSPRRQLRRSSPWKVFWHERQRTVGFPNETFDGPSPPQAETALLVFFALEDRLQPSPVLHEGPRAELPARGARLAGLANRISCCSRSSDVLNHLVKLVPVLIPFAGSPRRERSSQSLPPEILGREPRQRGQEMAPPPRAASSRLVHAGNEYDRVHGGGTSTRRWPQRILLLHSCPPLGWRPQ